MILNWCGAGFFFLSGINLTFIFRVAMFDCIDFIILVEKNYKIVKFSLKNFFFTCLMMRG